MAPSLRSHFAKVTVSGAGPSFRNHAVEHGEDVPLCSGAVHLWRGVRPDKRHVNAQSRTYYDEPSRSRLRPRGIAEWNSSTRDGHSVMITASAEGVPDDPGPR